MTEPIVENNPAPRLAPKCGMRAKGSIPKVTHWQRVTTRGRVPVALGVLPGARHLTEGVRKAAMRSNSVWDDCCQIPGATVESLLREVVERRKTGLGHHTETNVLKKKKKTHRVRGVFTTLPHARRQTFTMLWPRSKSVRRGTFPKVRLFSSVYIYCFVEKLLCEGRNTIAGGTRKIKNGRERVKRRTRTAPYCNTRW